MCSRFGLRVRKFYSLKACSQRNHLRTCDGGLTQQKEGTLWPAWDALLLFFFMRIPGSYQSSVLSEHTLQLRLEHIAQDNCRHCHRDINKLRYSLKTGYMLISQTGAIKPTLKCFKEYSRARIPECRQCASKINDSWWSLSLTDDLFCILDINQIYIIEEAHTNKWQLG